MTPAELSALGQEEFTTALGWIFEHSPWVARDAWRARPFASLEAVHAAMVDAVQQAPRERQLALLRAHPDLGTRARISAPSAGEQAGAGLAALSETEFHRLTRMNEEYRDKFGFPFIFAVKGSTKHDLFRALEARLASTPEAEFAQALEQVYRIAWFRLESVPGSV